MAIYLFLAKYFFFYFHTPVDLAHNGIFRAKVGEGGIKWSRRVAPRCKARHEIEGSVVLASPEALCGVLEQENLSSA